MDGIKIFNKQIEKHLIKSTKFLKGRKSYILKYAKVAAKIKNQEKVREGLLQNEDLYVPPILIISVTNDCNLSCKGCYACAQNRIKKDELTTHQIENIIKEGIDLGVSIVLIAGGEPLVKKNILDIFRKYNDTLFVMFTNGLLIDDKASKEIDKIKNMITVFSLEGDEAQTDKRRGIGVYKKVMSAMQLLNDDNAMFGTSITLTSKNYDAVINKSYLTNLQDKGCRALFLIEYVPCNGDMDLCLTESQKEDLLKRVDQINDEYSMLVVPLPGDEELFGGCLAAGRGFLHISSTGNVEACPFAPISDVNLKQMSLRDALKSPMIKKIRENHHLLEESKGGCALYENKEWIMELTK